MNCRKYFYLFISLILPGLSFSQSDAYTIKKVSFSSDRYDEFSPVFYNNGIVFCTNSPQSIYNYTDGSGNGLFKMKYIDTTRTYKRQEVVLFSRDLTSILNDGPATFSSSGDTIYYSRNLNVDRRTSQLMGLRNKLGIFSAVRAGENWVNIREFRFNSEWYNVTTPCLAHDGQRLYFSSDKPGGYGGFDIYYSQWKKGNWDDPVNLGPNVNTKGNESYPFINTAGELFFSSDGHKGLGGKDIFVTKQYLSGWYPPVRLDAPVNSEYDDFGLVTDLLANQGYFSSGMGKTIDIYQFKSNRFQFWFSGLQKANMYCFSVSDTGSIRVDTNRLEYVWDLGDGSKTVGNKAKHCFNGPGHYNISLDIVDKTTGLLFFRKLTYDLEVVDIDQPFINSVDIAVKGESIAFDGLKSKCPGYTITGFYWDFGEGSYGTGENVNHKFANAGEYEVSMGLVLKSDANGHFEKRVVSRKIRVLNDIQEKASYTTEISENQNPADIYDNKNIKIKGYYSAGAELLKESVFQVVIFSSQARISSTSSFTGKIPENYKVKEIFDLDQGLYSYVVDQQMNLMFAYPAYNDMIAAGFNDTRIRLYTLRDPAEKELYNLINKYGNLCDSYFDSGNKLLTNGILMLNQIAILMVKYPGITIEIGVHSDMQGDPARNKWISRSRAQMMVNYLVGTGMDVKRLKVTGYGGTRPVVVNTKEDDMNFNERVDFSISN